MTTFCHVCGCDNGEPPWGETGRDPTWDICQCCGCEFGYEDYQESDVLRWRENWLFLGAPWSRPKARPVDWKLEEQLRQIPAELPAGIRRDHR